MIKGKSIQEITEYYVAEKDKCIKGIYGNGEV